MSRVALITGSTSGIGLGIARAFAERGYDLMINGFGPEEEIQQIVSHFSATYGIKVGYHGADLSRPEQCVDLVHFTCKMFGTIDVLVNNAGMQYVSPIEDFPTERWNEIVAVNLSAPFHVTKTTLPLMRSRGAGRIINISSAHGLVGSPYKSAYVASKHGLIGLTKTVALEAANQNITCNAICPGWVLTPIVQKQIEAKAREKNISMDAAAYELLGEKHAIKKFARVEQIANLALFLASPEAELITGACYTIDGGWTAH